MRAQQSLDSFYVNSGSNSGFDPDLGEFAIDLGGFIPFARYEEVLDHFFASRWASAGAPQDFRAQMLQHSTDLYRLEALLGQHLGQSLTPRVVLKWEADASVWWLPDTPDAVHVWAFEVNGGHVQVVWKNAAVRPDPVHILIVNQAKHFSAFGQAIPTQPGESPYPLHHGGSLADPGQGWPDGGANKIPEEQAVERGDLVVTIAENYSADLWTALQRTQDAEKFVRQVFVPQVLGLPDVSLGHSYLAGGSWGGLVAAVLALLQPGIYAGAAADLLSNLEVGMQIASGDATRLKSHTNLALGGKIQPLHSDIPTKDLYLLMDVLGIRFDQPDAFMTGRAWDLAVLSGHHRPNHVWVPIVGQWGCEDPGQNWHWHRRDAQFNPLIDMRYLKHGDHGSVYGVRDGVNEFFPYDGSEWSTLIAGTAPAGQNAPLVPEQAPPAEVSSRPYGRTVRATPGQRVGPRLLREIDLLPDVRGKRIGQGVALGEFDHMQAADFDGDGRIEVFFGNGDGFFHVLQLSGEESDPTRLDPEFRSHRPLGWGLFPLASADLGTAAARVYLSDARGHLHRVRAVGPDQYEVDASFASPEQLPELYDNALPLLYLGNFHPGPGLELLLLNSQLDWVLLDEDGALLGRLQRSTRALGPGKSAVGSFDSTDPEDELWVPVLDGHLWQIEWDSDVQALVVSDRFGEFLGRTFSRVEAVAFEGSPGTPSHVLLFGRRADPSGSNRIQLVRLADRHTVEVRCKPILKQPAFAWIDPPSPSGTARFAVGGGARVEVFDILPAGGSGDLAMVSVSQHRGAPLTSLCVAEPVGAEILFVGQSNGRIFAFDRDLVPLRDASRELELDADFPGGELRPWPSNRTLAQTTTFDLHTHADGSRDLYFAEFAQPIVGRNYRVGRLRLEDVATVGVVLDPWVDRAAGLPGFRDLEVHDVHGDGVLEYCTFFETGTALVAEGQLRRFQNTAPPMNDAFGDPIFRIPTGGYLVEKFPGGGAAILDGFHVPRPSLGDYYDNGQARDWCFPKVGDQRISGQIAALQQGVQQGFGGTSMHAAELQCAACGLVPHLITGTLGGFVYAVHPGKRDPANPASAPSELSYASEALGWNIVGMDCGDIDPDAGDGIEIVVGCQLDTGTYEDHLAGDRSRNRGLAYILKAEAAGPGEEVGKLRVHRELTADRFLGGPGQGLTTGVFGICVDDVNGDGQAGLVRGCRGLSLPVPAPRAARRLELRVPLEVPRCLPRSLEQPAPVEGRRRPHATSGGDLPGLRDGLCRRLTGAGRVVALHRRSGRRPAVSLRSC